MTKRDRDFKVLYNEARIAGLLAVEKLQVQPMIVNDSANGKRYFVADGICGFAWVMVRPGNSPFANWLKKNKLGRSAYQGGVDIWVHDFNQSMSKKQAYASAFAKVISAAGIKSYSNSRMD